MSRGEYRAVLLTGRPGIGKTTIVRRVVGRLADHRLAGFYTEEIRRAGRRVGFRAVTLAGERATIAHVDYDGPERVGKYGVDVGAIDRLAEATLGLQRGIELYVIDEIGRMECWSRRFVDAVGDLLDARAWILATVARSGPGLIAEVKQRAGMVLREVNQANRESLAEKIAPWLAERLEEARGRSKDTGA